MDSDTIPPRRNSTTTIRRHNQLHSLESVTWSATASEQVKLSVQAGTETPGWSHFMLVPSLTYTTTEKLLHFDAFGLPPAGPLEQQITPVTFEHYLPAGDYHVTVHALTGTASTHVVTQAR